MNAFRAANGHGAAALPPRTTTGPTRGPVGSVIAHDAGCVMPAPWDTTRHFTMVTLRLTASLVPSAEVTRPRSMTVSAFCFLTFAAYFLLKRT